MADESLTVRTKRWRKRNPGRRLPPILDGETVGRMLEMRRKVLEQPIDLVYWDKRGNMVPAPITKMNPQLGAIVCRWATKLHRDPPYDRKREAELLKGGPRKPKVAVQSGNMDEYEAFLTDYIHTGGYPIDLLPQEHDLKLRGESSVCAVKDVPSVVHAEPAHNPLARKYEVWVPPSRGKWDKRSAGVFATHSRTGTAQPSDSDSDSDS
jgi:hypothetical protein